MNSCFVFLYQDEVVKIPNIHKCSSIKPGFILNKLRDDINSLVKCTLQALRKNEKQSCKASYCFIQMSLHKGNIGRLIRTFDYCKRQENFQYLTIRLRARDFYEVIVMRPKAE